MERLQSLSRKVVDELTFWGEVLVEVLGLDRNEYSDMIERHKERRTRELKAIDQELQRELYLNQY